ncbi:MAG: ATP-binding cassette domain-containing protein [Limisphaerales bacterium]
MRNLKWKVCALTGSVSLGTWMFTSRPAAGNWQPLAPELIQPRRRVPARPDRRDTTPTPGFAAASDRRPPPSWSNSPENSQKTSPVAKVGVVGASGSGKTTIANLLLRFRRPTTGHITVDGRDYWDFSAESWHCAVAVVEQEAFLFHDTMAQNIAYGFPEVSEEAVLDAVRLANLEDVVKALPDGLNTIVGERGMMLSGGQRQRLAIARALVRNPKILILDEATSSLDTLSERQVQAAPEKPTERRTILVITHRLSTIGWLGGEQMKLVTPTALDYAGVGRVQLEGLVQTDR